METRLIIQAGQLLAVFNSAHRVMKAEGLLKSGGFDVLLIPAPRALATDCGLALRFNEEILEQIRQTLFSNNLMPAFICRYNGSNEYTTIWSGDTMPPGSLQADHL